MTTRKGNTVRVNDKMQTGYQYILTEPAGRNFDPDFTPELSPKEVLALGAFGGVYMRDCTDEFPESWFRHAKFQEEGIYTRNPDINYFGMNASQPLSVWRSKGWIRDQDPRGWFQWYCRYYMGRRSPDDARQIKRWRAMKRHAAQIMRNCSKGDFTCRRRQRQALLHWAYDSRKL